MGLDRAGAPPGSWAILSSITNNFRQTAQFTIFGDVLSLPAGLLPFSSKNVQRLKANHN